MLKRILLLVMLCFGIIFSQSQPNLVSDYTTTDITITNQIEPYNDKMLVVGGNTIQLLDFQNQQRIWKKDLSSNCLRFTVLGDKIINIHRKWYTDTCYLEKRDSDGNILLQKEVPEEYELVISKC